MTGKRWVLLAVGLAAVAGGAVVARGWYEAAIRGGDPGGAEVEVTVPKGATKRRVGDILLEAGLARDRRALDLWLRLHPDLPAPKAGRHRLRPAMSLSELYAAVAGRPLPEDVPVTLVEGWRRADADAALAAAGRIEPGAYLAASADPAGYAVPFPVEGDSLAGYLLPDTYLVPPGPIDARALVQRQLDNFAARFFVPHEPEIGATGRSLRTLVIMASLLEREEPKPTVRPEVAGVLYNRLDSGTPLGVDATSRYPLTDWSDRRLFLKRLRDPNDPWNTRLRAGLPPGPIGAPSLPSLLAALRPKKTPYWYYLHDKTQQIHFSKNAAEHESKRRKYDVW